MACYHPLPAWRFQSLRKLSADGRPVPVEFPCGQCVGCQLSRKRAWALRITHEAACHKYPSSFVTLTYSDANYFPSLNYNDFKLFIRRVISSYGQTRYFVAGEYGSNSWRPHWHAILFGLVPTQKALDTLWGLGFTSIGEVNAVTAAYVAKYAVKSQRRRPRRVVDPTTGEAVDLVPEFARMSLRPGIGLEWFKKHWTDVYAARDAIVLPGGMHVPPPRYYDKKLEEHIPELRDVKRRDRVLRAFANRLDSTPQRLLVREACAVAALKMKKETL